MAEFSLDIPYSPQPVPTDDWFSPRWSSAINIDRFRRESSAPRPQPAVKLCWDGHGLGGIFQVRDRYVRCVHTNFQAPVYKDSCVEVFLAPKAGYGYFNFEFNAGGALLASYVTDPTRLPDGGLRECVPLNNDQCAQVTVTATLPAVIEPEIDEPVEWQLGFFIPFVLLAEFVDPLAPRCGDRWRGNFYKCADESSHPHWAAWAPVPELNFHRPDCFGELRF